MGRRGNDRIATHGRAVAEERSKETRVAVEKAMHAIERDIERGDGVYKHNRGAVNAAEVLRRAGLDRAILAKPRHRALRDVVNAFVERVSGKLLLGEAVVRKAMTDRTDAVTAELALLRQRYHEAELEHVESAAEVIKLKREVAGLTGRTVELEAEISRLRAAAAGENVIALIDRRKGSDPCRR